MDKWTGRHIYMTSYRERYIQKDRYQTYKQTYGKLARHGMDGQTDIHIYRHKSGILTHRWTNRQSTH